MIIHLVCKAEKDRAKKLEATVAEYSLAIQNFTTQVRGKRKSKVMTKKKRGKTFQSHSLSCCLSVARGASEPRGRFRQSASDTLCREREATRRETGTTYTNSDTEERQRQRPSEIERQTDRERRETERLSDRETARPTLFFFRLRFVSVT
jgi:hypothetical protein